MVNLFFNIDGKDLAYKIISQEKAKELMETQEDIVILDVRTEEEFLNGHILGAINIPNESIDVNREIKELPDKEKTLLIYCRSGYRSKLSAEKLAILGYKNIYEFGGINTWKYQIVK